MNENNIHGIISQKRLSSCNTIYHTINFLLFFELCIVLLSFVIVSPVLFVDRSSKLHVLIFAAVILPNSIFYSCFVGGIY